MIIAGWVLWYIVALLIVIGAWVARGIYTQETREQDQQIEDYNRHQKGN